MNVMKRLIEVCVQKRQQRMNVDPQMVIDMVESHIDEQVYWLIKRTDGNYHQSCGIYKKYDTRDEAVTKAKRYLSQAISRGDYDREFHVVQCFEEVLIRHEVPIKVIEL